MKLVSVDIETTGLDFEKDKILEIALVAHDTEKNITNSLVIRVLQYISDSEYNSYNEVIHKMNGNLISFLIKNREQLNIIDHKIEFIDGNTLIYLFENDICWYIRNWLENLTFNTQKIVVTGKNFSTFDLRFFEKLPNFQCIKFSSRILDPSILYIDWENDELPPNLETCKIRSCLFNDNSVKHTALDDAIDTLTLTLKRKIKL